MRNPENVKGKDLSSSYFPAAAYNGGNIEVYFSYCTIFNRNSIRKQQRSRNNLFTHSITNTCWFESYKISNEKGKTRPHSFTIGKKIMIRYMCRQHFLVEKWAKLVIPERKILQWGKDPTIRIATAKQMINTEDQLQMREIPKLSQNWFEVVPSGAPMLFM